MRQHHPIYAQCAFHTEFSANFRIELNSALFSSKAVTVLFATRPHSSHIDLPGFYLKRQLDHV